MVCNVKATKSEKIFSLFPIFIKIIEFTVHRVARWFLNIFHCIFSVVINFIWVCCTCKHYTLVVHSKGGTCKQKPYSNLFKMGQNWKYLLLFSHLYYVQQGYSVYKYICSAYSNEIDTNWKYATKNVPKIGARLVFIGIDFTFSMTQSRICISKIYSINQILKQF